MHFLRNSSDYLPRRTDDDCLRELRWFYDRRDLREANRELAAWFATSQGKHLKLVDWLESNIGETLSFDRLPQPYQK